MVGLAVCDLENGQTFGLSETEYFPLASVAKLVIAAFALASCEEPGPAGSTGSTSS